MFEEAKKPLLLMSDLRPMPLWIISKGVFGTKINFWATVQAQAITCTQAFFHGMKVDPKDIQKYHSNLCANDSQRRYPDSKFGNFFKICSFAPCFLVNKKSKDIFFEFFMIKFCPCFGKISKDMFLSS